MKKLLFVFVLLLLVCLPVLSQDATAEATVAANPVTVIDGEGGDTTVIVESPETPAETPATPASFLGQIFEFVLGAIVGAGLALGSAAAWIKSAMNDPVKMTLAESAARGISPETLKQVLDFLDTSRAFVVEASDGVPMVSKQQLATATPTSSASSTGGHFDSTSPRLP